MATALGRLGTSTTQQGIDQRRNDIYTTFLDAVYVTINNSRSLDNHAVYIFKKKLPKCSIDS